jgi:ketosteroid isomerase-like protein
MHRVYDLNALDEWRCRHQTSGMHTTTPAMNAPSTDSTHAVLERFNRAFLEHDPSLLPALIAPDCVVERITPTPESTHLVGSAECLAMWQALASNREGRFTLGEVWIRGDLGLIFWQYRLGATVQQGLNVMTVRDGLIVEGRGYTKGRA